MKPIEVLIVDDNAADVLLIRIALAGEPYPMNLHVAVDGQQALELLIGDNLHPDLLILDLDTPRMTGMIFLELYRSTFPIVVFTSSTNLDDERRALELGAREFVRKPFHFEPFADEVSRIFRKWASPGGSAEQR